MLCLILLRDIPNQFVIFEDRADIRKWQDVLLPEFHYGGMVFKLNYRE